MAEYDLYCEEATKGMIADTSLYIIDSRAAEEFIPFGVALKRGTSEKEVAIWDGAVTVEFFGIAAYSPSVDDITIFQNGANNIGYEIGSAVNVVRTGRVYVDLDLNITVNAGDLAYVEVNTGNFTNVATNNLLVGRFENNAVSGISLAIISI